MDLSLSAAASENLFIERMPERVELAVYVGKLLLPGNDMTITVSASRIAVYVDGRLARIGRPRRFVDAFVQHIRTETAADLAAGCEQIHIIGVWHDNGPNSKSFEPYLVQKAQSSGEVATSLYRYNIFHFDHHRSGETHHATIEDLDDPRDALDHFESATERLVPRDELPDYVWANGHPCGILWCPVSNSDLPPFAYRSVGLRQYRTRAGARISADEVKHFDATGYARSREVYDALLKSGPTGVH